MENICLSHQNNQSAKRAKPNQSTRQNLKSINSMVIALFILAAIVMRNKIGALIALACATIVDASSEVAFEFAQQIEPMYVYYVALFLIAFAWWIAMCRIKMIASQIVAGIACAFMSLSVLDCYFSDGYQTIISMSFPFVIAVINIATVWAAWHDRNWTYADYSSSGNKHPDRDDKVDIRC